MANSLWSHYKDKMDDVYDGAYFFPAVVLSFMGFIGGGVSGLVFSMGNDAGTQGDSVSAIQKQRYVDETATLKKQETELFQLRSSIEGVKKQNLFDLNEPKNKEALVEAEKKIVTLKASFNQGFNDITYRIATDETLGEKDSKVVIENLLAETQTSAPAWFGTPNDNYRLHSDALQECRLENRGVPAAQAGAKIADCTDAKTDNETKMFLGGGAATGLAINLGLPFFAAAGAWRRQRREEKAQQKKTVQLTINRK